MPRYSNHHIFERSVSYIYVMILPCILVMRHKRILLTNSLVFVESKISVPRNIVTGVPQGSILAPILYSPYINNTLVAPGTQLAQLSDGIYIYATEKHECSVLCKLQHGLTAVKWDEQWNMKINDGKTQSISIENKSP
jgi:hypothetical protein